MRVLVLGAGSVALCAIYWAKRLGAGRIVAMSRSARRRAMALEMGADTFIHYGDNEIDEVAEALGGPPDIVYECVGNPGFVMKGIQHVRTLGQVVSMGFCTAPDQIVPALAGFGLGQANQHRHGPGHMGAVAATFGDAGNPGQRRAQVALDVDGQRLERGDVEDPAPGALVPGGAGVGDDAVDRPEEGGEGLARPGGGHHQGVLVAADRVPRPQLGGGGFGKGRLEPGPGGWGEPAEDINIGVGVAADVGVSAGVGLAGHQSDEAQQRGRVEQRMAALETGCIRHTRIGCGRSGSGQRCPKDALREAEAEAAARKRCSP